MADYIFVGGELYHYGVKGMKWGVRKKRVSERVQRAKVKFQDIAKKSAVTIAKLAKDPRVQIGTAAAIGITAGAFGHMGIANIMATRAFTRLLSYGESQINDHMTTLASEGYRISEPTVDSYGIKKYSAYLPGDNGNSEVRYEQNLRTGSVHYDFSHGGRSFSNGEMLIGDLDD